MKGGTRQCPEVPYLPARRRARRCGAVATRTYNVIIRPLFEFEIGSHFRLSVHRGPSKNVIERVGLTSRWKLLSIKHFIRTYETVLWYLIVMNINDVLLRGRMVAMSGLGSRGPGFDSGRETYLYSTH